MVSQESENGLGSFHFQMVQMLAHFDTSCDWDAWRLRAGRSPRRTSIVLRTYPDRAIVDIGSTRQLAMWFRRNHGRRHALRHERDDGWVWSMADPRRTARHLLDPRDHQAAAEEVADPNSFVRVSNRNLSYRRRVDGRSIGKKVACVKRMVLFGRLAKCESRRRRLQGSQPS
jgi:hypothetical protein